MGEVGVGKSSLINGLFGQEVAKAGVGKPVTQHLEKYVDEEKGLILWDTKGIEAKDYKNTMESIKKKWKVLLKRSMKKRRLMWRICALRRLLLGLKKERKNY
nr:GTPase [Helicobacter pylori]